MREDFPSEFQWMMGSALQAFCLPPHFPGCTSFSKTLVIFCYLSAPLIRCHVVCRDVKIISGLWGLSPWIGRRTNGDQTNVPGGNSVLYVLFQSEHPSFTWLFFIFLELHPCTLLYFSSMSWMGSHGIVLYSKDLKKKIHLMQCEISAFSDVTEQSALLRRILCKMDLKAKVENAYLEWFIVRVGLAIIAIWCRDITHRAHFTAVLG